MHSLSIGRHCRYPSSRVLICTPYFWITSIQRITPTAIRPEHTKGSAARNSLFHYHCRGVSIPSLSSYPKLFLTQKRCFEIPLRLDASVLSLGGNHAYPRTSLPQPPIWCCRSRRHLLRTVGHAVIEAIDREEDCMMERMFGLEIMCPSVCVIPDASSSPTSS